MALTQTFEHFQQFTRTSPAINSFFATFPARFCAYFFLLFLTFTPPLFLLKPKLCHSGYLHNFRALANTDIHGTSFLLCFASSAKRCRQVWRQEKKRSSPISLRTAAALSCASRGHASKISLASRTAPRTISSLACVTNVNVNFSTPASNSRSPYQQVLLVRNIVQVINTCIFLQFGRGGSKSRHKER